MDEVDGYDETLCPLDYEISGMISDDEVNETIVRPLPRGVKLHAVIDACHSGSSLDLPFVCKTNRWFASRNFLIRPPICAYEGYFLLGVKREFEMPHGGFYHL